MHKHLIALGCAGIASLAHALGPCDCTVSGWTGNCIASLEVKQDTWVKVTTNVSQSCSRVDWYADEDPQMTVVINGAEIENLAPKRPKTLTVQSCKVCKDLRADRPVSDPLPQARPTALSLSGKWSSVQKCSYGTGTSNMEIQYDESSGTISGKLANATIDSGSINGTKIRATASNWFGNRVQLEGEVVGPSEIRGTYSQSAMAGTCTWEARKLP